MPKTVMGYINESLLTVLVLHIMIHVYTMYTYVQCTDFHCISEWPTCMIGCFLCSIQNVWEMTIMVDKIACHSCTACPPAIILRLFIVDTISFPTVYS